MTYIDVNNHNHISHPHANHGVNSLAKKSKMTFKNFQAEQNPGFPSAASYSHRMGLHPSSMAMTADQFSLSSAAQVSFFSDKDGKMHGRAG